MELLSAIKSCTPTLNADVLRMTNIDATNNTTKWQQTSITFLGYRTLYANYPFSLLESVKEIQGKYYLSLCNFGIQCKLLHLLCCSQLYVLCLLKSPKQKYLFTRFSHSEEPPSCVNVTLHYCFNHWITIFDFGKSTYRRPQWMKYNKTTFTAELYYTIYTLKTVGSYQVTGV